MANPVYLTVSQAATLAGCARSTVRAAVRDGRLSQVSVPTIDEYRLLRREVCKFRPRPVGRPKKGS